MHYTRMEGLTGPLQMRMVFELCVSDIIPQPLLLFKHLINNRIK